MKFLYSEVQHNVHSYNKLCVALKLERFNMRKIKTVPSDGFFSQVIRCACLDLISLSMFPFNLWGVSG